MNTAVLRPAAADLAAEGLRILDQHRLLLGVVAVYTLAGIVTARALGLENWASFTAYSEVVYTMYACWIVGFLLGYPVYVMVFVRPKRLTRYLGDQLRYKYLTFERLFQAGLVLVSLPFFTSTFSTFKWMIPHLGDYTWDPTFMVWDRWLHGGVHPWELLQPLLGEPLISSAINFFYHLWFFILFAIMLWQAFSLRDPHLRMQFYMTLLLSWILLGSVAAIAFASVGPCYYGIVTGLEDPYLPLMTYLNEANESYTMWALNVQQMLWDSYQSGEFVRGHGISAMPSMHVSAATLFALFGWRVHRRLGIVLTIFAVLTLIGSVHLGWHYAIDGYASAAGTIAIWYGAGWLVKRRIAPASPASLPA